MIENNTITVDTATSFGLVANTSDGMTYSYHVDTFTSVVELIETATRVLSIQVTAQRDNEYNTLSLDELRTALYEHRLNSRGQELVTTTAGLGV